MLRRRGSRCRRRVCSPTGCLPVTKGSVAPSGAPLPGYGLVLLNRQPVKPEHNSPCGATECGATVHNRAATEYLDGNVTFGVVDASDTRDIGQVDALTPKPGGRCDRFLSPLYSQPLELGFRLCGDGAARQRCENDTMQGAGRTRVATLEVSLPLR